MTELKLNPTFIGLDDYPEDFSPCHRRVLSARNINPQQLKKSLGELHSVEKLTGAKDAAIRISNAINNHEKIVVVGDYDADGATAMSVIVSVLKHLGADYDCVVPNRVTMGYGLSEEAVKLVVAKKAKLVITVDNGISAVESVAYLNQHSIDVIITDHHMPPSVLPDAQVIVNPNCVGCHFPSKALAGVGVAFYVVLALRQVYREQGNNLLENFSMTNLLAYVAIGTIADVVPLDFNNRILVDQGLKRMRAGHCSAGILALISVSGLSRESLSSVEVAFQLAPRLNAAGRIADMQLGVDCLLAQNDRLATDYAVELDRLNRERKSIENEMKREAARLISEQEYHDSAASVCLYDANWNEGLIGILAARIKEKHAKTAFVFTNASQKGVIKGSARSGQGVNLVAALNQLNANNPHLIQNYGGHVKAAGLSLNEKDFTIFSAEIEKVLLQQLDGVVLDNALYTDGELLPYEFSIDNAIFLKNLEPWGQTVPEPIFENVFYIDQIREVGKNHAQLQMIESQSDLSFKGIAFDKFAYYDGFLQQRCQVAFRLSINEWRGQQSISLIVEHMQKS
ncbi:MAG: single-stranded-DNA-specific exonuclease RecJ [Gammaproteobacteria bacterium]|nr:single-stranded-DNA-specific exonuclease RecJ [Gammaproteobacteria bacterium]